MPCYETSKEHKSHNTVNGSRSKSLMFAPKLNYFLYSVKYKSRCFEEHSGYSLTCIYSTAIKDSKKDSLTLCRRSKISIEENWREGPTRGGRYMTWLTGRNLSTGKDFGLSSLLRLYYTFMWCCCATWLWKLTVCMHF